MEVIKKKETGKRKKGKKKRKPKLQQCAENPTFVVYQYPHHCEHGA